MDKDYILSNIKGRATSRFIKCHYPEEYDIIIKMPGNKFAEQLYNYFYNCPSHICPVCGKITPFRSITTGFSTFCSIKCSYKSDIRINKIKSTCLEKYGVENPSQSKEVQKKKEETCLKNYGVNIPLKSNDIKNKVKSTCLEKYGVENPSQSKEVQKKKEETCLKNYGVKYGIFTNDAITKAQQTLMDRYGTIYTFESKEFRNKLLSKFRNKFLGTHSNHIGYTNDGNWICSCINKNCDKCEEKTFIIPQQVYNDRIRLGSELCTKLMPIGKGFKGTSIEKFITNILDEFNISYLTNKKSILGKQELDIYIPSKNIAIECNGIYWHSTLNKPNNYHINKFKLCKDNNIRLITIWEDWIKNKPEIVRSIILSKLGIYEKRIYARKCILKEVKTKECNTFLNENHIQGKSPGSIKYGLYYNNNLVSVMTFVIQKQCVKLVRFCNKKNYQIIGGASKLFNHFIKLYNPNKIISYSSNDISDGNLYKLLGFYSNNKISNAYWYVEHGSLRRYHRELFQKNNLKRMGFDVDNLTEYQIMDNLPYFRIYDSGIVTWVWGNKKGT